MNSLTDPRSYNWGQKGMSFLFLIVFYFLFIFFYYFYPFYEQPKGQAESTIYCLLYIPVQNRNIQFSAD